jgi:hypothetical protein
MNPKDRVVCIDDSFDIRVIRDFVCLPVLGEVYTIREIKFEPENNVYRVLLEEIENPPIPIDMYGGALIEPGFSSKRFIPLEVFENIEQFALSQINSL